MALALPTAGDSSATQGRIDGILAKWAAEAKKIAEKAVKDALLNYRPQGLTAWGVAIGAPGEALTAGQWAIVRSPPPGEINRVWLDSENTGTVTVDIKKFSDGTDSATATSICGSSLPALSGTRTYSDQTLSGWTTTVAYADGFVFIVNGSPSLTGQLSINFEMRRS